MTIEILFLILTITALSTIVFGMAYYNLEVRKKMANSIKELENEVHQLELETRRYQLWKGKELARIEWEDYKKKTEEKTQGKGDAAQLTPEQLKQIEAMFKKK